MVAKRRGSGPETSADAAATPEGKSVVAHAWAFKARFRANAFGWKSQPAITRVREAIAEIKKVAKKDPMRAAEGAVLFLERVSGALAHVDGSSGSMGSAVNRAIEELVPILANAPADVATREAWLERLHVAHGEDQIPYIETLGEHWGELCVTKEIASRWADRELAIVRHALSPEREKGGIYHGTTACLAALFRAERHAELVELLDHAGFWPYKRWAVKALAAVGKKSEAIRLAEASRGPWTSDADVAQLCEGILLSSGLVDEAFTRYAAEANRAGTYLATFRVAAKKYPTKSSREVLNLLVASTPGDEGKWFAAAKDAGLFAEALELATRTPCDPRTLARAARDHVETEPSFAIEAGMAALDWIAQGYGYEITGADVWAAYDAAKAAGDRMGTGASVRSRARNIAVRYSKGENFVAQILRRELVDA